MFVKHLHRDRGHPSERYWAGTGFVTLGGSIVLKYVGLLERKAYFPSVAISDYLWTVKSQDAGQSEASRRRTSERHSHERPLPVDPSLCGSSAFSLASLCISRSNLRVPLLMYLTPGLPRSCPHCSFFLQQTSFIQSTWRSAMFRRKHNLGTCSCNMNGLTGEARIDQMNQLEKSYV